MWVSLRLTKPDETEKLSSMWVSIWHSMRLTKPDEAGKLSSMWVSMWPSMRLTKPHEEGYWVDPFSKEVHNRLDILYFIGHNIEGRDRPKDANMQYMYGLLDEIVNREVCYPSYLPNVPDTCRFHSQVQIRNCGSFYLYYLVTPPNCDFRYCSE